MKNSKGMIFLLAGLASLALIVAVAYFLFSQQTPKPAATTTTVAGAALPESFDPVEYFRKNQTPQAVGLDAPTSTTVPTDPGYVVTMPSETTKTSVPGVSFPSDTPSAGQVEFPDVPKTTTTTVAAPKVVAKPAKPVAKAPAKAAKTVTVTEFWIQVGAFKDRYQADAVGKILENQGLKGTLTTATVNGVNLVRVRVGPYANQDEAKKFLAWVKPVAGLEAAYITQAKSTRTE